MAKQVKQLRTDELILGKSLIYNDPQAEGTFQNFQIINQGLERRGGPGGV